MVEHKKFPSIESYKQFVSNMKSFIKVNDYDKFVNIRGTVKLHGTHADLVCLKTDTGEFDFVYQSRNRVISVESDNCGFAEFMTEITNEIKLRMVRAIVERFNQFHPDEIFKEIFIAGEFCGQNIQKNVALTQLPKMFVMFHLKINNIHQDITLYGDVEEPDSNIFNIIRGGVFREVVDVDNPFEISSRLKELTDTVEKECPFAKSFGISGIGEGIVWLSENHIYKSELWFKVKGLEHSVTKVSTLIPPSKEALQALSDAKKFAEQTVTERRLEQGVEYLKEMNLPIDKKNTGKFIQWIISDTMKEEQPLFDEIKNLEKKQVTKAIMKVARKWYMDKC